MEPLDLPAESLSCAVNCSSSEKRITIFIILPCLRVADFISLGFGFVSYFFTLYFTPRFLSACHTYISTDTFILGYIINRSRGQFACLQRVVLSRKQSKTTLSRGTKE